MMDLLEYDLDLCQPLVPVSADDVNGRRRSLALRLGAPAPSDSSRGSLRRSLMSKREAQYEIAVAEKNMQRLHNDFVEQQHNLRVQCGHFRGAVAQVRQKF